MDGTDLLLDSFRRQLCTPDDPDRVIAVDYPYAQSLSIQDLASLVVAKYLSPLERDRRGYVLVNQSFSGHVGLQLAIRNLRRLRGQVFVNCFASPPGPKFLQNIPFTATSSLFKRQPPPWMVSRIFLGPSATGMDHVQAAASRIKPEVMSHRLSLCLTEDSWHLWRNRRLLPSSQTLYLRGDNDLLIPKPQAQQLRSARPDIEWVTVPKGPHLLLQRYGTECGVAVENFCSRMQPSSPLWNPSQKVRPVERVEME